MNNYQLIFEEEIKKIKNKKPTLLLHACCAPCCSYVFKLLINYFKIKIFYYNPNIMPEKEYYKRGQELYKLDFLEKKDIIIAEYFNYDFKNKISGLENEKEGGIRCNKCFELRLEKTAKEAKQQNFEYFATTLTISPHKNAQIINKIGSELEKKYSLKFLTSDFKKNNGYKNSIELSKKYELYRQNYCGC